MRWSVSFCGALALASGCFALALAGAGKTPKEFTLVYHMNAGGYITVCGCTHKEVRQGSLVRRANLLQDLRATGRKLLIVDGGSSLFPIEDRVKEADLPDRMRKAELIIEACNRMGYSAMAVGSFDLAAGIDNLLKLEKRAKYPFISANLLNKKTGKLYFKPHTIVEVAGTRVGLIGLTLPTMGSAYRHTVAPDAELTDPVEAARKSLDALRGKVDLVVALSHLREEDNLKLLDELPEIEILVDPFIQFHNHHTWIKEEEWISFAGDSLRLRSDGQGARMGVLDLAIFRPRAKFLSRDRFAEIEEEAARGPLSAELKAEKESFTGKNTFSFLRVSLEPHWGVNPDIENLIAKWKAGEDPARVSRLKEELPHKNDFLTVEKCKECHEKQYKFWLSTPHAEAVATLVESGDDDAFDCIGCHTLGYGAAYVNPADVGAYANVQCESCHGTNPAHAEDPQKHSFNRIDRMTCVTCHNKEILEKIFNYSQGRSEMRCPRG